MSCHLKRKHNLDVSNPKRLKSEPGIPMAGSTPLVKEESTCTKTSPSTSTCSSSSDSDNSLCDSNVINLNGPFPLSTDARQLRIGQMWGHRLTPGSMRAKAITKSISMFIACDLRPYSIVDSPSFRRMVNKLDPQYVIPTRNSFANKHIPDLYTECRKNIMNDMKNAVTVAATSDGWSSRATDGYVTVTGHYIDKDWNLQNPVLQCRVMYESHNGENTAEVLNAAVEEWGMERPHGFIPMSTDNAAAEVKAVRLSKFNPHQRCFAHTLNLAAQRVLDLPEVKRTMGKVRSIVSFFHRSNHAAHMLSVKQQQMGLPAHKLIIEVKTRWNSAFDMFERFLEQQTAVIATVMDPTIQKANMEVSSSDLHSVGVMVELLKPLKSVSTILCDAQFPTISVVLPFLQRLKQAYTIVHTDTNFMKKVKKAVKDSLDNAYKEDSAQELFQEASFIDPRFKTLPWLTPVQQLAVANRLITQTEYLYTSWKEYQGQLLEETGVKTEQMDASTRALTTLPNLVDSDDEDSDDVTVQPPPPPPPLKITTSTKSKSTNNECPDKPEQSKSAMESLLGDIFIVKVDGPVSALSRIEEEMKIYRNQEAIEMNCNPLTWWKKHQSLLPILSVAVRHYLCIPATSVPSERVFSTAGDVVSAQRACLKPQHVDMLVFVKQNIKYSK